MPIMFQTFIERNDLLSNPNVYYVFGDNDERVGLGGQAKEMRGEPNAIGIRTKKSPYVYYYDYDYEENIKKINEDFERVKLFLQLGKIVVFPRHGVGSGLAKLHLYAPRTLQHINQIMSELEDEYRE